MTLTARLQKNYTPFRDTAEEDPYRVLKAKIGMEYGQLDR